MMKTKVIQGHTIRYKTSGPEDTVFDNCVATVAGATLGQAVDNLRALLAPFTVVALYKSERTNILLPEES